MFDNKIKKSKFLIPFLWKNIEEFYLIKKKTLKAEEDWKEQAVIKETLACEDKFYRAKAMRKGEIRKVARISGEYECWN